MAVRAVPAGYRTVTPYLVVKNAAKLLAFVERGLGAKVKERHATPDGKVMHAAVKIGDSMVMMGQARKPADARPSMLYLYVKDTDALYRRAIKAGATSVMKPANQFYGDRNAGVKDSEGNQWWIATHVEDISRKEMARRSAEAAKAKK
ncbi:MAG: VOC family protein [Planctomycetes bacterium]|nr:VOC family protein [Planctomycetota bacterium]